MLDLPIWLLIGTYIAGGIYTAGMEHAAFMAQYKTGLAKDEREVLHNLSWSICYCGLLWPIVFFPILISSGFGKHGWSLTTKPNGSR